MVIPRLLVCVLILSRKSLAWSSWFSSEASTDDGEQHNDHLVSPIVNREIQVSVKAHDWPSSPQSILCEAYALEKEDPSFLDRLTSIVLEKKAAETTWLHDDAAARNLAIQASLHPKLLEWSLVLRAASPYCELMRSLAPS